MDDLISRQATIDTIEQHEIAVLGNGAWDEGIAYGYAAAHRHLVDIIKQLPSAERHGHWVYDKGDCFPKCSVCRQHNGTLYEYRYCPTCGALMDGDLEYA